MTQDPANKTVIEGESVKFGCEFSGDPKPTITWEKNAKSLSGDSNTKITNSASGSVLTISNTVGDNSGKYRCVATLKHITERTEEATLLVKGEV